MSERTSLLERIDTALATIHRLCEYAEVDIRSGPDMQLSPDTSKPLYPSESLFPSPLLFPR